MAIRPNALQQRVILAFIRRNSQGWGRPLAFTVARLRTGGIALILLLALLVTDGALNGASGAFHPTNGLSFFLTVCAIGAGAYAISILWSAVPSYVTARSQPAQTFEGVVNAAICNAHEIMPLARTDYHFITVRGADDRLRAFAVPPEFHDQLCHVGKRVRFTVTPGIDAIVSVADR